MDRYAKYLGIGNHLEYSPMGWPMEAALATATKAKIATKIFIIALTESPTD